MEKVLVGLSGGVDSSVCAILLKQAGYQVIGATMRLLDEDNIVRIYNQLYACTQVSESVKEQHVENLHHKQKGVDPFSDIFSQKAKYTTYSIKESGEIDKIHSSNRQSIERDKRCPICGGKLVVRTATKGENKGNQFYGCSNYPKCLYIRDIIND